MSGRVFLLSFLLYLEKTWLSTENRMYCIGKQPAMPSKAVKLLFEKVLIDMTEYEHKQ